jgi:CBS domain-containing protein
LQEAAEKMSRLDLDPLPVCDGERVVGMLTGREVAIRATATCKATTISSKLTA